jgi:acyl dehydratase
LPEQPPSEQTAPPRPAATLDPTSVKVGDRLPLLVKTPTTQQLVQYAGASYDYYQIHYDTAVAQQSGLPGVIVHGLLKAGFLAELVTRWAGPDAFVRRLEVSYRGIDRPDQKYRLEGEVTALRTEPHGVTVLEADVWGEDPNGKKTTLGSTTVEIG